LVKKIAIDRNHINILRELILGKDQWDQSNKCKFREGIMSDKNNTQSTVAQQLTNLLDDHHWWSEDYLPEFEPNTKKLFKAYNVPNFKLRFSKNW
jgi:hypothetical protein